MTPKIPQTLKEANGFGSGLAPCYVMAVGNAWAFEPKHLAD